MSNVDMRLRRLACVAAQLEDGRPVVGTTRGFPLFRPKPIPMRRYAGYEKTSEVCSDITFYLEFRVGLDGEFQLQDFAFNSIILSSWNSILRWKIRQKRSVRTQFTVRTVVAPVVI